MKLGLYSWGQQPARDVGKPCLHPFKACSIDGIYAIDLRHKPSKTPKFANLLSCPEHNR